MMQTITITPKWQIHIPKKIREQIGQIVHKLRGDSGPVPPELLAPLAA